MTKPELMKAIEDLVDQYLRDQTAPAPAPVPTLRCDNCGRPITVVENSIVLFFGRQSKSLPPTCYTIVHKSICDPRPGHPDFELHSMELREFLALSPTEFTHTSPLQSWHTVLNSRLRLAAIQRNPSVAVKTTATEKPPAPAPGPAPTTDHPVPQRDPGGVKAFQKVVRGRRQRWEQSLKEAGCFSNLPDEPKPR